eukprot:356395-Chlamydomonas_euryale.AAC.11
MGRWMGGWVTGRVWGYPSLEKLAGWEAGAGLPAAENTRTVAGVGLPATGKACQVGSRCETFGIGAG